jgi:hypothetical protein
MSIGSQQVAIFFQKEGEKDLGIAIATGMFPGIACHVLLLEVCESDC